MAFFVPKRFKMAGWGKFDNLGAGSAPRKVLTDNTTYTKSTAKALVAKGQIIQRTGGWGKMNALNSGDVVLEKSVKSTNLKSFKYDAKLKKLTVTFVSGFTYMYFNVPKSKVEALERAPSKGVYFAHNIRHNYTYKKL
jgi:hypothetical protein